MKEAERFQRFADLTTLHRTLLREYRHEVENYKLNDYIVNLITEMGFIIENRGLKHKIQGEGKEDIVSRE